MVLFEVMYMYYVLLGFEWQHSVNVSILHLLYQLFKNNMNVLVSIENCVILL